MANTIQLKRSGAANAVPSSLQNGEVAVNYADGKLFYKDGAGTIQSFGYNWNVASATKLQTPRLINGVPFDGSQDITISGTGGTSSTDSLVYAIALG